MSYEIQDGIQMPEKKKKQLKYPLDKLEVGQSFFVAGDKDPRGSVQNYKKQFATQVGVKPNGRAIYEYGVDFEVRAVTENGVQGFRIWRTK